VNPSTVITFPSSNFVTSGDMTIGSNKVGIIYFKSLSSNAWSETGRVIQP
jgi:hypothetical protein